MSRTERRSTVYSRRSALSRGYALGDNIYCSCLIFLPSPISRDISAPQYQQRVASFSKRSALCMFSLPLCR